MQHLVFPKRKSGLAIENNASFAGSARVNRHVDDGDDSDKVRRIYREATACHPSKRRGFAVASSLVTLDRRSVVSDLGIDLG